MGRKCILFTLIALGVCLFARADAGFAIRAGTLIDVDKGTVLHDQVILVRGERIEKVQPASMPVPDDLQKIDLSAYTVLPGLIDCHTHLIGLVDSEGAKALELSPAQYAFTGVKNAKVTLMAGFTSVRDVGTYRAFVDLALRDAINDGTVPGPRMACAGAYITVRSGGGDITGISPDIVLPNDLQFGVVKTVDDVREKVRQILNQGADLIKLIATGAVLGRGTNPGATELSEDQMRAAVEEAAQYSAKVAAHAHGADGIKKAVRAGVASIEHGSLIDDEGIQLMVKHGTYLVADIYNGDYIATEYRKLGFPEEFLRKNDETTDAQRQGFRKAVAAGVKIAYGTDASVYPHGDNAKQLPYMVRYGMTPMGAVQSATISAARLIGWEDRVGSIAAGKYADIIAIPGDPMADLTRFMDVAFVMKGGQIYKSPK